MTDTDFDTLAVHAGNAAPQGLKGERPVVTPIHMSVGYAQRDMETLDRVFSGDADGNVYARYGSPTVRMFEQAVAELEKAGDAVAYASGMAAVLGAILGAGAKQGSKIACARDLYGASIALVRDALRDLGIGMVTVDTTDLEAVTAALTDDDTCVLLCETVSNPLLVVADISELANIAHAHGAELVVDGTFSTPYLCRPLLLGADYVVHSATKYISGHGDVMAGVVACSVDRALDLRNRQKLMGANLAPMEAWLALRGIRTLALRMRQHCTGANQVARWLAADSRIAHVNYPGLAQHPQHELAQTLFEGRGFGGMVSFDVAGAGREQVFALMEALKLIGPVTTLGDVYSLMLYPAMSSHRALSPTQRHSIGIGDGLVRLSVGIENPADIVHDLDQAIDTAMRA